MAITFTLRDKNATTSTSINCKLRYDYKTVTVSTGESIHPNDWNLKTRRAKFDNGNILAIELNERLDSFEKKIAKIYSAFITNNDRQPSPEEIKRIIDADILGKNEKVKLPRDFYGYAKHFIETQSKYRHPKTNKKLATATILGYKNTVNIKLKEFDRKRKETTSFETIDLDWYYKFVEYLEKKDLSPNTIGRQIKILKTILNDATSNGINKNLKYRGKKFITINEETDVIYLNESELKELEDLDLTANKRLENARNQFLILCYTGQRFQSLKDILNPKNRNGNFIEIKQPKTNKRVTIPILTPVSKILDSEEKIYDLSNVRLNLYIKEVCKLLPSLKKKVERTTTKGGNVKTELIPIHKLVCTHTGRRSFATNFYNDKRFSINQIMSITGHTKESTFFAYVRTTPQEHAQRFLDTFKKIERGTSKLSKVV